jgi:DNA-binding CsgD family transcriptional regulator
MNDQLTGREISCLRWVAKGKSSWEIGGILRISEHTVNFHVKNAMAKLLTTSRTVAAIVAAERGIIPRIDDASERVGFNDIGEGDELGAGRDLTSPRTQDGSQRSILRDGTGKTWSISERSEPALSGNRLQRFERCTRS